MPRARIPRLSLLIDEFLRPCSVGLSTQEAGEVVSLTKEKEKDLLIALSRVLRTIQLLTRELNSDPDSDSDSNSNSDSNNVVKLNAKHRNCLIKVLADLILLLRVESQYVEHLVGNILFVVSEFLASSLVICRLLSCPSSASTNVEECLNVDYSMVVYLRDRMQCAKWSTAAEIVRVLWKMLKCMKQEHDEEMFEVYLASVGFFLLDVPWEVVDEKYFERGCWSSDCGEGQSRLMDDLSCGNLGELDPKVLFLGNFVQFICSIVDQSNVAKPEIGCEDQNPVNCKIVGLVPKLFQWCLGKHGVCGKKSTSRYFGHKLLMLMLRLTYQTHLDCIMLLSWLQLLHDYFEELLRMPITELESGQNQCLEGSPFLLSNLEAAECGGSSLHLQRHVVLLFLRCCCNIIKLTAEAGEQSAGTADNLCLNHASSEMNCSLREKGLLELCKWIQVHIPTDAVIHSDLYQEKCAHFARSFLQLYIHEDGALFKVLLLLLSIQSYLQQGSHAKRRMLQDVKGDCVSDFSKIFNPITLFHLFLAELHYDHQVLLDYLISKDTGVSCAEYLLRFLHYVCESWTLFMTYSLDGGVRHQSSYKKRKIPRNVLGARTEPSFVSPQDSPSSEEQEGERDLGYGCKHHGTERNPFNDAKDCLLSLKHSVENLHLKNLFPYNPKVLLKRLSTFQELCINKDNELLL